MISPDSRMPVLASNKAMPPGEWPGVWMTSKARFPRSIRSPSASAVVAGGGGEGWGGGRASGWPALEHVIGGIAIGERPFPARVGQDLSFRQLDATIVELVMGADVLEMGGCGGQGD